jgi:hypothetical protein
MCCDLLSLACSLRADFHRAQLRTLLTLYRHQRHQHHHQHHPLLLSGTEKGGEKKEEEEPPIFRELDRGSVLSPQEAEERQRRRVCYWYYLLRAPLWDAVTGPTVDAVERITGQVPLLGGLFKYATAFLHYSSSRHFYAEPV